MEEFIEKFKARVRRNRLGFFITGALGIAFLTVSMSLGLYYFSGTAQLDLSRPDYQEAREQARREAEEEKRREKKPEDWIIDGKLTVEKLDAFENLFNERMQRVEGVSFDADTLNDRTLNLETNKKENR